MEHCSFDRHIDSDTRFTRGMWEMKAGVTIRWAGDVVKQQVETDSLYQLAATIPIRDRGGTLNNPLISSRLFSPREGIVGLEAYHHKSKYVKAKEPRFALAKNEKGGVGFAKTDCGDKISTLSSGGLTATSANDKFGMSFDYNGKKLSELGFRSLGWVDDSRFNQKYMTVQFGAGVGEKFYGFGERFGPFVKNGQRVETWNEDGGTSSEWAYKSIPMYLSSRGYAIFVDSASDVVFEVQSERTTRVNISVPGEGLRVYVVAGDSLKHVLERYTGFTGRPALPPPWTFGLWLTTSFTTDYDINTVSSFLQGMKDREIPLRTFHFDCFWMKGFQWCDFEFDPEMFPDAKQMLSKLKKDFGIEICVWINPYIAQESSLFAIADENNYLIQNVDGSSYQTDLWQAGMGIVDFTNPDAIKWYKSELKKLVKVGVDSFKTDFGERIPCKGVKYHDGSDPIAMHNYYTQLYNKAVFEVLEEERGKNQACLFARSATVGGQQFPVHWGGDCMSTFEAMAETLRGGLSLGSSGFGFWSHDISGFEGGTPDPAVYKRWCAFGLLSSHSRLHGSSSYRVPWNFDDESSVILKKFTYLKLSLMPYIYNAAIEAHEKGVPVLRSMLLEFQNNANAEVADAQFMLGESLLVAPVFNAEGDVRYFVPGGRWYGYLDGKVRETQGSGDWINEVHNFESLPLLVRENTVFITGKEGIDVPDYDYAEGYTVNLFDLAEGTRTVQIPNYKNLGKYSADIKVEKKGSTITVTGYKGFQVKVLGTEKVSVDHTTDANGNAVIKANGSVSFTV